MISGLPDRRLLAPLGAALLTCVIAFLALTALGVDGSGGSSSAAGAYMRHSPPHPVSAIQAYSEADSKRNGAASQGGAPPITQLVPVPPAAFDTPIAQYKAYSAGQLKIMLGYLAALQSALRANRLQAARVAWRGAYVHWLHLGAVYGAFGALGDAVDGNPGGLPSGVHDPRFTGLHRLERGLWRGASTHELLAVARRLDLDVGLLIRHLPSVQITPLEYATRAHEILEDAARDLLSGTDVPWSNEGVLATAAGLTATREVLTTLRPMLDGREGTIETVEFALRRLSSVLSSIRRAHGGRFPAQDQLSLRESELLNGTLGAALEALDAVPGTLETKVPPSIPALPRSSGSAQ
jgi:iron uptake system EfeUOB component EfeO/EfeM